MSRLILFACLACLFACLGFASADPITFAVTNTGRFGTLDLGTGNFTPIGDALPPGGYSGIGNLADGTLVGVDGRNHFLQIDGTTGEVTIIGSTGINVTTSASLLTGEQYAVDDQNALYQIDPATGAGALVGPTGIPGVDPSFANALAGDDTTLYYIYEQGGPVPVPSTLFQLDLATGAATPIGPTGTTSIVGAGFVDGTLFAYSFRPVHRIFTIDLTTGAATDTGVSYSSAFLIFGTNPGEAAP